MQAKGQGLGESGDPVPSVAPTGYAKAYDGGRPDTSRREAP